MSELRISDEWSARGWREVLQWLRKDDVYDSDFRRNVDNQLSTVLAQKLAPDIAYDVGCAEGTFTRIWLDLLRQLKIGLPKQVKLFEPNRELLDQAFRDLKDKFQDVVFEPIAQPFERWMDDNTSTSPPSLVVISHASYYFANLDSVLHQIRRILEPTGLLWIVARNRDCGLYRARFSVLARTATEDTAPQHYADAVMEALKATAAMGAPEWKTAKLECSFDLKPNRSGSTQPESTQHRVFSFFAHLQLSTALFREIKKTHPGWNQFSETHILATPRHIKPVARSRESTRPKAEDREALALIEFTDGQLRDSNCVPLDIQLARFHHPRFLLLPGSKEALSQDAAYRPHRIAGRILLWGLPTKAGEKTRTAYFGRHPSFLLYRTFFSQWRAPIISRALGRFAEPYDASNPLTFTRLPDEILGETWQNIWDGSTFDVAFADWQEQAREQWSANLSSRGDRELICMAVPSRLTPFEVDETEAGNVDTSAALFITALGPRSANDANRLKEVYKEIQERLRDYVGQTAAQVIQGARDEIRIRTAERYKRQVLAQQHTVFNNLSPLIQIELLKDSKSIPEPERLELEDSWKALTMLRAALDITFDRQRDDIPTTLAGLLGWLVQNTHSARGSVRLEGEAVWEFTSRDERRDAFTLFWNLLDNATKGGPATVRLASDARDEVAVDIINQKQIGDQYVAEFQRQRKLRDGSGIQKIVEALDRREWGIEIRSSTHPARTMIRVAIVKRAVTTTERRQ